MDLEGDGVPAGVFGVLADVGDRQAAIGADLEAVSHGDEFAARAPDEIRDDFEVVAAGASGDLAYTVGYEHTTVSWDGIPLDPYTLRVTHVYRREDGEWKIIHRHADSRRRSGRD